MEPKSNIESLTNISQNDAPFADACMDGLPFNFDSDCVSSWSMEGSLQFWFWLCFELSWEFLYTRIIIRNNDHNTDELIHNKLQQLHKLT